MHLLSQIPSISIPSVLVAFGTQKDRPEGVWCMTFGLNTVHTVARSGKELIFTAQENPAPAFNPPAHWVVTLMFESEAQAGKAEESLRALHPVQFFHGDGLAGIVAHAGHSLQSIGVSQSVIDRLA
jgi:hypothetical protein